MKLPEIISEIQKHANLLNKEVFIDTEEMRKDGVFPVMSENNFLGFIYCFDNKPNAFCIFNNHMLRYAFEEGFKFEDIYKAFNKKLFLFVDKEQFIHKLFQEHNGAK